ncbi:MAG TPA: hypothetical protein DD727_02725, partial [Clostridiales bacterium]|nr:hypothetical protein [Clostridiales bacterium]
MLLLPELYLLKKPAMILFDFGDTLITTDHADFLQGTRQVLAHSENPGGFKAEDIQAFADQLNTE